MNDLTEFAAQFDNAYPNYVDERYTYILNLINNYANEEALQRVQSAEFTQFANFLLPLIAIKNYKSQIPFPETLQNVVTCCINIKLYNVNNSEITNGLDTLFNTLINTQGFQLPTVSAIFHFCHPNEFPIVDRNVAAACMLLNQNHGQDFDDLVLPALPYANANNVTKLNSYRTFITFITRIKALQSHFGENPSFRFIDKALMVLGNSNLNN